MIREQVAGYFRQRFSTRIFAIFILLIFSTSLVFTLFFYRYQSRALTAITLNKGELLASLLAYNVKLGTFAENHELLANPVEGTLKNADVLAAEIYSFDGRLLESQRQGDSQTHARPDPMLATVTRKLARQQHDHFLSQGNFVFWSRVDMGQPLGSQESIYFEKPGTPDTESTIGFVKVVVDGRPLQRQLHALLLESCLIAAVFLILGSAISILIAKRMSKPLNRLTTSVKAFGREGTWEPVEETGDDEIGNLARAFNTMAESLQRRESEKNSLEEQLRHSQKMEAIGTLAGGVAHDFNNILTAVGGYCFLLKNGIGGPERETFYVSQISEAVDRAASLTQRLLAFSRKQLIDAQPVDVNRTIRTIDNMLSRLIGADIELVFNLTAPFATILASPGHIDQLLINLVANARDAMPAGGTVTITTVLDRNRLSDQMEQGECLVLTVRDTGVGMADDVKEKIFNPFFTTKEVGKGTGLGLSIVYGIVRQLGGTIELDSSPGEGATFRILLPLDSSLLHEPESHLVEAPGGGNETVLVAEDDPAVMQMLREVLESNGYAVVPATNGEEAIARFLEHGAQIDIALLDVVMPKKNGREVHEEISRLRPGVKTLFMTGYPRDVLGDRAGMTGDLKILPKPLRPGEVLTSIREVLEG